MELAFRRIVLFSADSPRLVAFYRDVMGLKIAGQEPGWTDFSAGACNIAIHNGPSKVGARSPKLVFYAADVGTARTNLISRGFKSLGPVKSTATFDMCDGKDPDGNRVGISSRR